MVAGEVVERPAAVVGGADLQPHPPPRPRHAHRRLTLRHALGVEAFGLDAWRAPEAGHPVIEKHGEEDLAHQEVYVVISGEATFVVGGETIPAPAGTVVFVEDYTLEREATANEPGTTVLAIGAERGRIFTPSSWETDLLAAH